MKKIVSHYSVVLIPFIKDIYEIIQYLLIKDFKMDFNLFDLIAKIALSILLAVLITRILILDKKIKALNKYTDSTHDSIWDIIDLNETISRRKMNYLYRMLKNSTLHIPEPKDYLSSLEKNLLLKLSEKRQKEINEAIRDFSENDRK